MKKIYLIVFAMLLTRVLMAQVQFDWAVNFQGNSSEYTFDLAVDSQGSAISVGYFSDSTDFDPGLGVFTLAPVGGDDAFISKLNPDGTLNWVKQFESDANVYGYSVTLDGSDNVYVSGYFNDTVDFDPGVGVINLFAAGSSYDAFICKLNSSGDFIWVKQFTGTGDVFHRSLEVDAAGNVYSTGEYDGSVDFDPGAGVFTLNSVAGKDIFITKMDTNGNFVWAKTFGGGGNDNVRGIVVDAGSNVYTVGDFIGLADFDPGSGTANLIANGSIDVFISKLDSNGDYLWASTIGGSGSAETGKDIVIDNAGNVIVTGTFTGDADLDPTSGVFTINSYGSDDIFVSKLTEQGDFLDGFGIGGTGSDISFRIETGPENGIYIAGSFSETANFNPSGTPYELTSVTGTDPFVMRVDNAMNLNWAIHIEGSNLTGAARGLRVDSDGNVYTSGHFTDSGDFDPNAATFTLTSTSAATDVFVQKLSQPFLETKELQLKEVVLAYPNPAKDLVTLQWNSNELARLELLNTEGTIVATYEVFKNGSTVDFSKLANGIYYLRVMIDAEIRVLKIAH